MDLWIDGFMGLIQPCPGIDRILPSKRFSLTRVAAPLATAPAGRGRIIVRRFDMEKDESGSGVQIVNRHFILV